MSRHLKKAVAAVLMSAPAATLACLVAVGFAADASAQSATRGRPMAQPAPQIQHGVVQQGSTNRVPAGSTNRAAGGSGTRLAGQPVGLGGYCPVCIIEMKKWMKGNPAFSAVFDGKTYYFPGEEQRQMFLASPAKYTPALGGDCTVCLTEMGNRKPGSVHFSAVSNNRLYLFPSEKQKQMFVSNPNKYLHAEVALGGKCAVCKVEMGKDMQGVPEISTIHNGMKYQFPSDEQRKMFIANPGKYAAPSNAPPIPQ